MNTMIKDIAIGTAIAVVLTGSSYGAGLFFGFTTVSEISYFEVIGIFTAYICTYLCNIQKRINYPFAIISVMSFCVLFFQLGLMSSVVLQIYLFPTLIYGWFYWRTDDDPRPVSHVEPLNMLGYIAFSFVVYGIIYGITTYMGATSTITDSIILVLSILAQFLMDRKKLVNWVVWIAVNIIAIYTYWVAGAKITAIQYGFFLLNAVWGYILWNNSMILDRRKGA